MLIKLICFVLLFEDKQYTIEFILENYDIFHIAPDKRSKYNFTEIDFLMDTSDMAFKILCKKMAVDIKEYHYLLTEVEIDEVYEILSIQNAIVHVQTENNKE